MIINKVYKGTIPFVKGYKGTTVIFEEGGGGLPSEYQEVAYIKTTSYEQASNYLDTGVVCDRNKVIELKLEFGSDFGDWGRIAGYGNIQYMFNQGDSNTNPITFAYGSNSGGQWNAYLYTDTTFRMLYGGNYVGWYINNELVNNNEHYFEEAHFDCQNLNPNTIYLFFCYGGDRCGKYYLFRAKIWDCDLDTSDNTDHVTIQNGEIQNATLLRDFVPCYIKATNEVGMYDLVTQEFYGNAGNVPFVAGPDVEGEV